MNIFINIGIYIFAIRFPKSSQLPFSGGSGMFLTITIKIYPDSILAIISLLGLNIYRFKPDSIKNMPRHPFVLSQFLRPLTRYEFQRIVNKYKGDFHTKHFKCWDHLASMMMEVDPIGWTAGGLSQAFSRPVILGIIPINFRIYSRHRGPGGP